MSKLQLRLDQWNNRFSFDESASITIYQQMDILQASLEYAASIDEIEDIHNKIKLLSSCAEYSGVYT